MSLRSLIFFFGTIFFLACGGKNNPPKGILSEKKMTEVLWDVMQADQFLTDYVFSRDTAQLLDKRKESVRLYRRILTTHKVSEETFRQSFTYYKNHPEMLKVVFDSVGNRKTSPPSLANDTIKKDPVKKDTNPSLLPPVIDTLKFKKNRKPIRID